MRKMLFVFVALLVSGARADNIITSREYVDTQANTLQTELPAKNTNTVLLNTDTAGELGEKAIYDASADYAAQSDALVTAGAFNTAVQNALESEFVCIERQNGNGGCLLYEVRGAVPQRVLPSGYTQLEYLESTGTQYINTQIAPTNDVGVSVKYAWVEVNNASYIYGSYNPHYYLGINSAGSSMVGAYGPGAGYRVLSVPTSSVSVDTIYQYDINLYNSGTVQFVGLTPITTLAPKTFGADGRFITLFYADSSGYFGKSRIYYMKITDGSTLVRNFIPARRDSDGVLGMYDTVTNTFFTNYGTGKFIAGPVASYLPQAQGN